MATRRRKLVSNSLSLLITQITQNATSLLFSISVARILGPYTLGQYTLAFTFYFIFMTMSSQGLKTLLTRELARHPENVEKCLVSGTALQFSFSTLAYIVLVVLVNLLPYRQATTLLCMVVGAAVIPFGLSNVTEAIFQSQEKMHLITISTVPIYIIRLIIMVGLLVANYSIQYAGVVLVLSEVIILVIEQLLIRRIVKPKSLALDWDFIRTITLAARTFVAIESISVLKVRMQVLILSLLAGETVVGLYSAAVQLLQPFQLISQSLAVASLPTMARTVEATDPRLRKLAETVVAVLLVVAIPMIIGFFFIGGDFMVFLYRDPDFQLAGMALTIAGLTMIPLSFTRALSYLLMARGY
ncbi:MAG: oligosaccharide flippase family protein, partial [Anaerolineae bacterium]|nr:oligosaccharide flippase family protein [Anaerolineae bacterium]